MYITSHDSRTNGNPTLKSLIGVLPCEADPSTSTPSPPPSLPYTGNHRIRTSKVMTVELMEIPRCFSISIKSDWVLRWEARERTAPASLMAPPYSKSFSVKAVLFLEG